MDICIFFFTNSCTDSKHTLHLHLSHGLYPHTRTNTRILKVFIPFYLFHILLLQPEFQIDCSKCIRWNSEISDFHKYSHPWVVFCKSIFGSDYNFESSWVWISFAQLDLKIFSRSSLHIYSNSEFGWGAAGKDNLLYTDLHSGHGVQFVSNRFLFKLSLWVILYVFVDGWE